MQRTGGRPSRSLGSEDFAFKEAAASFAFADFLGFFFFFFFCAEGNTSDISSPSSFKVGEVWPEGVDIEVGV